MYQTMREREKVRKRDGLKAYCEGGRWHCGIEEGGESEHTRFGGDREGRERGEVYLEGSQQCCSIKERGGGGEGESEQVSIWWRGRGRVGLTSMVADGIWQASIAVKGSRTIKSYQSVKPLNQGGMGFKNQADPINQTVLIWCWFS